jgi:hypothetical protein
MLAAVSLPAPAIAHCSREHGPEIARSILLHTGALIVDHAAAVGGARADLEPWFTGAPPGEGLFLGRSTRRFSGLFAKAPGCASLAADDFILAIIEPLLLGPRNEHGDAIQLHLTQAIAIDPGQDAQPLHRDDTAFPIAHDHELMVNVMWPLDEFTAANGATRIVPESHRWPRGERPTPAQAAPAEAGPNDAILWLGSTFHGGGANTTARPRRGVVFSYSLAWLAQAEKLLLSTPPDVARALPERVQRLIGYQVHRPNLGWIEERDPREWLLGAVGPLAPAQDHFPPALQTLLETALGKSNGVGARVG